MRGVVLCLAVLGLADVAAAADLDDSWIRGSDAYEPQAPTFSKWEGFYAGGQVGASTAHFDFSNATQSLVAFMLRGTSLENTGHASQLQVLQNRDTTGGEFGGFVGYNSQWDSVVIGLEVGYNRSGLNGSATNSINRFFTPGDGYSYDTVITGQAGYRITDYGELRARAGYVVGNFLPYASLGIVVGRANISRTANLSALVTDLSGVRAPFIFTQNTSEGKQAYVFGMSGGLGLDVNVWSNVFLRGEYEFTQFNVTSNMLATLHSFRVGGGVKF